MAIKKSISAKPAASAEAKTPVKKAVAKKAPAKKAPAKKVAAKKTASPKKVATAKKAVKKAEPKVKKETTKKPAGKPVKTKASADIKGKASVAKTATELLVDAAVEGVLEVKGRNISVLDLKEIHNRVCDYYIICQADSTTQVNAIAGSVEKMVKDRIGERPYHTEGFQNSEWILVDYVTVVVHVFQSQVREFYNLEALWADAEVTKIAFD